MDTKTLAGCAVSQAIVCIPYLILLPCHGPERQVSGKNRLNECYLA